MQDSNFFANASDRLPAFFAAKMLPSLLPGMIAIGTVYNAISHDCGPKHEKINGRIVLERDSFLEWLSSRPRIVRRVKNDNDAETEV